MTPTAPPITLGRDFARALDPVLFAQDCGIDPDPWQADLLHGASSRVLMLCARQAGKSTTTALIAAHAAIYSAPQMIVLVSPSLNQSRELFTKVHGFWEKLPGAPEANQETLTRMSLANGSRIVSLPGSERTTRGYSGATLIIMDEAARVDDALLPAIRPMLATTSGTFIALSTPAGKRGWFYEQWTRGEGWHRVKITAEQCPRIRPEFLAEERAALGTLMYEQEYECIFHDAETSAFSSELIEAALTADFEPFFARAAA
jgi:hypothetical protein